MDARIVISGMGAVTPLGADTGALWSSIADGARGIGPIQHFAGTPFESKIGGSIPRSPGPHARGDAAMQFALRAALEAFETSGRTVGTGRLAIVIGTTMSPQERLVDQFAAQFRDALGRPDAPVIVVSTACTSSSAAVGMASALLHMGAADWVLAGGTDELDLKLFAGFHALGLLSDLPCVPFGQTVGTNLGEGAAFFVFEREEDARSRSHEPIAILEGFGTSCDGYHATSPHPSGDGLVRAARAALREAGVVPSDIDWVSAHGTGTRANDAAESWVITRLFEERAHTVPVSASKSLVGHTLGAAGTVELAIAILALQNGCIPPTAGVEQRRAECSVDVVIEKRAAPSKRVLKLGAAFGGANAALVIALPDAAPAQARVRPRRTVRIVGAGAMGGAVAAIDPMGDASDLRGPIGRFAFEDLVRGVDPRGLDATSRYLIVAAQRALERAGIALGGATSDRTGLFVGQRRASPASHVEFEASIASRGLAGVSRSAFTRKVLNTATGAASRGLSLRGPTTTLSTGRGGGLVAVALAAEHLATRDEADVLLAGAVEELGPPDDEAVTGEGAAVIALAAAPACIRTDDVVLAGWAIGGPHQGASVARQALERAGLDPATVVEIFSPGRVTGVPAFAGVLELGRALASIRSGTVPRALVVEAGSLATTAFVLVAASPGDHDAC